MSMSWVCPLPWSYLRVARAAGRVKVERPQARRRGRTTLTRARPALEWKATKGWGAPL